MTCASCGGQDEPCCVSNFCDDGLGCTYDLKCVLPYNPDTPTAAPAVPPPPAPQIIWISLAAVGGLLLLGLVVFFVWRSRKGSTTEAAS